jgi:radical SAM/Cys-rich protein
LNLESARNPWDGFGMNDFEQRATPLDQEGTHATGIDTIQTNVGLKCNQSCVHCHLKCSPDRTEMMEWPVFERIIEVARQIRPKLVDLTGGSPELNPHLPRFIEALHGDGHRVQSRTNLTVLLEPGLGSLAGFFRDNQVQLVASMPCYLEENVCAQRGEGVYQHSVEGMRLLNSLGYGTDPALSLSLVYNPGGPFLPPIQSDLEGDYRRELGERFGITFTSLLTIANMPIGRFGRVLSDGGQMDDYMKLLKDSFNPGTVEALMCRHQVSIGWDGTLYDCDFNLALGMSVNHGAPDHILRFEPSHLEGRRIVTGSHCFGCTAGQGSSCGGALT